MIDILKYSVEIELIKETKLFIGGSLRKIKGFTQYFKTKTKALNFSKLWENQSGVETITVRLMIRRKEID